MATTLLAAAVKSAAGHDSTITRYVNRLPQIRTNLSSTERAVSLGLGTGLLTCGLSGRGPTLFSALAGGYMLFRASTGNCLLYQTLGVSTSDSTASNSAITARHGTRVEHAISVAKPVEEVYRFWRDFENLPRFMAHLVDVDTTSDGQSRWVARGPLGFQVAWEAEIIDDIPNEMISWRSRDGADVDTAGSVHFQTLPGDRGTAVRVNLKYDPPAGQIGTFIAKIVGRSPAKQIKADMRRFRQILEAGETPTTRGQSHGRR